MREIGNSILIDKLEAWIQFERSFTFEDSESEVQFDANHAAYSYAIAAFYAGWVAAKEEVQE